MLSAESNTSPRLTPTQRAGCSYPQQHSTLRDMRVAVVTQDTLIRRCRTRGALKIDTESTEPQVLRWILGQVAARVWV